MNAPIFIPWLITALLASMSIILLMGKGSFMVAGYNLLRKEEKEKYNVKKLCRVVGGGMAVIAIILGIATAYRFEMPAAISWIIPWGLLGTIAVIIVLANTICWKKANQ